MFQMGMVGMLVPTPPWGQKTVALVVMILGIS
jgi:hypothetical protein